MCIPQKNDEEGLEEILSGRPLIHDETNMFANLRKKLTATSVSLGLCSFFHSPCLAEREGAHCLLSFLIRLRREWVYSNNITLSFVLELLDEV